MAMAVTLPINLVWSRTSTRLRCLLSRRPGVVLSYQLVIASPCRPLIAPPSCCFVAPAGCGIASPCPLIALPSRHLVPPAGCRIASHRPLIAPPSRQLVAPACYCIASPRPLAAPHAALSPSRCAGWLLRRLSMHHPLVVLLSHCAASHCLFARAGCCAIISRRPLIAPPSCPLIMLTSCCITCPCAAFSSFCHSPSPMPSNAIECCCRLS